MGETRSRYERCVSEEVLREAGRGDADAATQRLAAIADCLILPVTNEAEELTARIIATGLIPPRALRDATQSFHGFRPTSGEAH